MLTWQQPKQYIEQTAHNEYEMGDGKEGVKGRGACGVQVAGGRMCKREKF